MVNNINNQEKIEYKNESHNDIALQSSDKITLINIFSKYFGKKECWSQFHFIHSKEIKDYTLSDIDKISIKYKDVTSSSYTIDNLKEIYSEHYKSIKDTSIIDSFIIKTNFEFPLIKGDGGFKVTKGFIDLIVHLKPLKIGEFCCYPIEHPQEFVIPL